MYKGIDDFSKYSYVSKDFASIYPDLLDLAVKLTNKWHPSHSNESDPGVVLLKEGAFMADHLNYNTDKNILEGFLPTAVQETSVRNLVEAGGYLPNYYIAATGTVSFHYEFDKNNGEDAEIFNIPTFTLSVSNEDNSLSYVQTSPLVINSKGYGSCEVAQGYINDVEVNGETTITIENIDDDNRFYLNDTNVAQNGVYIRNAEINENLDWSQELWKRENYLNILPPHTKAYKLEWDSDREAVYIEFPSDISEIIGAGLKIKYLVTGGAEGNIPVNFISVIESNDSLIDDKGEERAVDKFTLYNPGSFENGKNPETIEEMYHNFKEVVGTFNTLVTCKDYSNAIKQLEDNNNTRIVSNAVITDTTNDYNNALKIVSYDKFGPYLESANITFTPSNNFRLNTSTIYMPGNFSYDDIGRLYLCNHATSIKPGVDGESGDWTLISDMKELILDNRNMSGNDLKICGLIPFKMSRYSTKTPELALEATFKPVLMYYSENSGLSKSDISLKDIKESLSEYKCISTNFKNKSNNELYYFKVKTPLDIQVTTYERINDPETFNSIKNNIFKALTKNFNASMIEFGDNLDLDEVYFTVLNSDSRIKNIYITQRDEDTQTVGVIHNDVSNTTEIDINELKDSDDETEKYKDNYQYIAGEGGNCALLVDLVAKNVLAGRLCLFNFVEDFDYNYGQKNNEFSSVSDIKTYSDMKSQVIELNDGLGPVVKKIIDVDDSSKAIRVEIPSNDLLQYIKKIDSNGNEVPIDFTGWESPNGFYVKDNNPATIKIDQGESIVFGPGDQGNSKITIKFYKRSEEVLGKGKLTYTFTCSSNKSYIFKSLKYWVWGAFFTDNTRSGYTVNTDATVPGDPGLIGDVSGNNISNGFEITEITYPKVENEVSFKIPETKGDHYLYIATPSYADSKIFPSFCYYRLHRVDNTVVEDFIIPANQDIEIKNGYTLQLLNKENNEYIVTTYVAGDVINSTFKISSKDFYENNVELQDGKGLTSKTVGGNTGFFKIITAGNTITYRELMETELTKIHLNCYWVTSNPTCSLFEYDYDQSNNLFTCYGNTFIIHPEAVDKNIRIGTILNNGEYFFYSNQDKTSLAMFGPGTLISIPADFAKNTVNLWSIEKDDRMTFDTLSSSGLSAGIPFKEINLTTENSGIYVQEMDIITLTSGDTLKIYNLNYKISGTDKTEDSLVITNRWNSFEEKIPTGDSDYYIKYILDDQEYTLVGGKKLYYIKCDFIVNDDSDGVILQDIVEKEESSDIVKFSLRERLVINSKNEEYLPIDLINEDEVTWVYNKEVKKAKANFSMSGLSSTWVDVEENKKYFGVDHPEIMWYDIDKPKINDKEIDYEREDLGEININTDDYTDELTTSIPFFCKENVTYVIPIYLTGNTDKMFIKDNPISIKIKDTSDNKDIDIFDLGIINSEGEKEILNSLTNEKYFYLVTFDPDDDKRNLNLELNWVKPSNTSGTAYINILPIKVYDGPNSGLVSTYFSLDDIMNRMRVLVKNSNKNNTNIYYINEPDNTISIQDDNIYLPDSDKFNPAFLFDKNNIANPLTLPMIDIVNTDVYLTKAVKGYRD